MSAALIREVWCLFSFLLYKSQLIIIHIQKYHQQKGSKRGRTFIHTLGHDFCYLKAETLEICMWVFSILERQTLRPQTIVNINYALTLLRSEQAHHQPHRE